MSLILVADDEKEICNILKRGLEACGYDVETAHNGIEALSVLEKRRPDLAILDIAMPFVDGIEVCRRMRADPEMTSIPICLLTAKSAIEDKISGFEAGCDDYLVKPFNFSELRLRARALLRRYGKAVPQTQLRAGAFILDPSTQQVQMDDRIVQLTPMEFALLHYLLSHNGEVLSSQRLLREVWGYPPDSGNKGLVRTHIRNLRLKIEPTPSSPTCIQTVRPRGYIFNLGPER